MMFPAFVPPGFIALAVIGVALIIALAVWGYLRERRRKEALRAFAERKRWSYLEKDQTDRPDRFRGFKPFDKGHSRYAMNVMTGQDKGVAFELFDYHYAVTTSNGKSTQTQHYYHRVCVLRMPLPAPHLTIEREHLGHKLVDVLGGEDIDFESDAFSRRFWVQCQDRRFAYDVIHPGMMEFLLKHPKWHWQWRGHDLLVFRSGKLDPEKAERLHAMATRFRELLPRHLLAAVRPAAPPPPAEGSWARLH